MQATCEHNVYSHAVVNTSYTPLDLIILLYDGAIEHLHKALFYVNQGNQKGKTRFLSKAAAIIEELVTSLNMNAGGFIAMNLQDIYIYMLRELTMADANNDPELLIHVEKLLRGLRDAWRRIK